MRDCRRIALVDGSEDRLRLISSVLETIPDVSVVRFTDPVEALSNIRQQNGFDLVVTEMLMNRMNATTFIRDLRSGDEPVNYWLVVYGKNMQSVGGMRNVACTIMDELDEQSLEILRGTVSRVLIDSEHQMNIVNLKLDVRSLRQDVREIKEAQVCRADLEGFKSDIADIVSTAVSNCRSTNSCPSVNKISLEDMLEAIEHNKTAMFFVGVFKFSLRHLWKIVAMFLGAFSVAVIWAVRSGMK